MSQNGKGDAPRPFSVDADTWATNHERTFGPRPSRGTPSSAVSDRPVSPAEPEPRSVRPSR